MKILDGSSYVGPITLEVSMSRSGYEAAQESAFLSKAMEVGNTLKELACG